MSLINPKLILLAALLIAVLLIAQAGTQTAVQVNNMYQPKNVPTSPFKDNIDLKYVDKGICDTIQRIIQKADPCKWDVDTIHNVVRLVVGERVVAYVQYGANQWNKLEDFVKKAIIEYAPTNIGRVHWTEYVQVEREFQDQGIGTYVLRMGDSLMRSGTVRLVLDAENWIRVGKAIPGNSVMLMDQLYTFTAP